MMIVESSEVAVRTLRGYPLTFLLTRLFYFISFYLFIVLFIYFIYLFHFIYLLFYLFIYLFYLFLLTVVCLVLSACWLSFACRSVQLSLSHGSSIIVISAIESEGISMHACMHRLT